MGGKQGGVFVAKVASDGVFFAAFGDVRVGRDLFSLMGFCGLRGYLRV